MLETIGHAGVSDVIVVVTRYFGGILLGTGGLVRAYTAAAGGALQNAELVSMRLVVDCRLRVPYARPGPGRRSPCLTMPLPCFGGCLPGRKAPCVPS